MALHAITIFLSAALLFQVQLVMGSYLLPWFGGGAGVWTACLAFFQVGLVAGYFYAHLLTRLSVRRQVIVHGVLVASSIALLPITPGEGWKPSPEDAPILGVLTILAVHVGLPFTVLSASAILLQRWVDVERPWILYAASNAGALLGLLTFPFLVEPLLERGTRATAWTGGYVLFALLLASCGALRWRAGEFEDPAEDEPEDGERRPSRTLWLLLPACSAATMLAVTSSIAQALPPTPFLWVAPLAIHLATFVITFAGERFYPRRLLAGVGLLLAWPLTNALYTENVDPWVRLVDSFGGRVGVLLATLFCLCLLCHGELYRARPTRARLSIFYVCIAVGGALGGVAIAVGAPLMLDSEIELNGVAVFTGGVLTWALARGAWSRRSVRVLTVLGLLVLAGLGLRLADLEGRLRAGVVEQRRNFYGSKAVYELSPEEPDLHRFSLISNTIEHGFQLQRPERRGHPTTYFTEISGGGLALMRSDRGAPRHLGVVGLGIGTLAAYAREADTLRFYEIDPNVIALAHERFDYLARCPAAVEVVLGDARLSLEREPPNGFDVLVLDAFTADVVPVHLLTRECFELYLSHLAPDGVLALHVTSKTLDFRPVLAAMARDLDLAALHVSSEFTPALFALSSDWVLMSRDHGILTDPVLRSRGQVLQDTGGATWTDGYAPMLQLIDWD